ncbi:unnamed protein product [Meloidogyne enterolobii]|uniref:Uncharacterized protein n=1 Tax=Meloidogyne enterolobii TaxID=390850 RepID=A0ACB0YMV3_MELEN
MDFVQSIDSSSRVIPSSSAFYNNVTSSSTTKTQTNEQQRLGGSLRRLKTVLVIDKKVQKFLKVREMACQDIEAVSAALNVNLQLIDFDRLDFGESSTLDKFFFLKIKINFFKNYSFYNADIALIDFSITHQQPVT